MDDDDNEVAPGEAGEALRERPQVMLGYWRRPDATDEIIKMVGCIRAILRLWMKTAFCGLSIVEDMIPGFWFQRFVKQEVKMW